MEVGYWHTHADYSIERDGKIIRTSDPKRDDFNSDNFSGVDRDVAVDMAKGRDEYKGYVGTPGEYYRGYDGGSKKEYVLEKPSDS